MDKYWVLTKGLIKSTEGYKYEPPILLGTYLGLTTARDALAADIWYVTCDGDIRHVLYNEVRLDKMFG